MAADVAALAEAVRRQRQFLDRQAGRAQQVAQAGKAVEAEIAGLEEQLGTYAKTAALLTRIGEEAQVSVRARFEALATSALQSIFSAELSFHFIPGETGGQATLEPVIRSEYGGTVTETPVLDARGGGMAAVVGFVNRLLMVLLSPGVRPILLLDESFAHVSESYTARVAEFIRELTDRTDVQIFMITHDPVFAQYADSKARFVLGDDGVTQVFDGESE